MNKNGMAGKSVSVGCAVRYAGTEIVYAVELFKPWTWLKWQKAIIIVPCEFYDIAIVKD